MIPEIEASQKDICIRYHAAFMASPLKLKMGVSRSVLEGARPLNGLRHHPDSDTCGWFIWAGEGYSEDPDFFIPIHVLHLQEICPFVIKYLRLAPGWRFLVTEDYEDVWEDLSLITDASLGL